MLDAKKGHIVSIASMASYFSCCGLVDYAATKAGVLALHEGTLSEIFDTVVYCLVL
jgi:all-trans-retinol dehydrogenase (NAD+)